MKKYIICFAILFLAINLYSQITFEKGYFINNKGERIECFIKNLDWKNNPKEFIYKKELDFTENSTNIKHVKEFGVYNTNKFVRVNVEMDRSSNDINNLSDQRNPIFKKEELFLKILVQGAGNLFSYEEGNLKRYFYSLDKSSVVKQLVYKRYNLTESKVATNQLYKQQLLKKVNCDVKLSVKNLQYNNKSLSKYFIKYNDCLGGNIVTFSKTTKKRKAFNITLKVGVSNSSLSISNPVSLIGVSTSNNRNVDFESSFGVRFGSELEYVLPFNNNKWSLFIEPMYQSFKSNKTTENVSVSGGFLVSEVDYKSLEVPFGVKHNFFLGSNSSIYVTGSYLLDFDFSSSIKFNRANGSNLNTLDVSSGNNFSFSLGYKYNKYSVDVRYNNRNILRDYILWTSDYQTVSINLGYQIF